MLSRSDQHGDTIIEVLFAVAVFSLVAISAMTIMNLGTAAAQRSLEITLVRQQMDAQADAIRYIHQAYITNRDGTNPAKTQWINMTTGVHRRTNASTLESMTNGPRCTDPPEGSFVLDTHEAKVAPINPKSISVTDDDETPPAFSQVIYDHGVFKSSYGIWVEAVPTDANPDNAPGPIGYVDFHIRACWESLGSNKPVTLGTIVRLYEPN